MIVDSDIHPEKNIFYISAKILELIRTENNQQSGDILILFEAYNKENVFKASFDYFLLSLDWLFMLGLIELNHVGSINYVSR